MHRLKIFFNIFICQSGGDHGGSGGDGDGDDYKHHNDDETVFRMEVRRA